MQKFTENQQRVVDYRGDKLLVSASAGTGKTTVMIERIASLIAEGVDVSNIMVVTFTNLAAAEMKNRLTKKLMERRNEPHIAEQLEKLDGAKICTIHSFCNDLLRNYFFVVDITPTFSVLDNGTLTSLASETLDAIFKEYFESGDELFLKVYKIFATGRREDNFKAALLDIYHFSRCLENFEAWYAEKKQNFLQYGENNPIVKTLRDDVKSKLVYYANSLKAFAEMCKEQGLETFAAALNAGVADFSTDDCADFYQTVCKLIKVNLPTLPRRSQKLVDGVEKSVEDSFRQKYDGLKKELKGDKEDYSDLINNKSMETLWQETAQTVELTDKLAEILFKFDKMYFEQKKQLGGVEFSDMEQLTLRILENEDAAQEIGERYKLVFVDEYQDTSPIQEAIISRLAKNAELFMVGDVKQSIYGFRGCDPTIFLNKYHNFKRTKDGCVEELNNNFRSNGEILDYVNDVFDRVMTAELGKVDYKGTARLCGSKPPLLATHSVQLDLAVKSAKEKREIEDMYDITRYEENDDGVTQGEIILSKINRFVGMAYKDKNGEPKRITYGDIVILMRSINSNKCADIYNTLVQNNVPVMANFKLEGYANKEVRDLVTLLRVLDNPYNDVYMVGLCLTPFGGFSENELAQIKIATQNEVLPFLSRMQAYAGSAKNDNISAKIDTLLVFLNNLRFFARSATVDEVVLKVMKETRYHLFVEGLPNGSLRLKKLYAFVDGLKGASFAQSVERFLLYLDETEDAAVEDGLADSNAVRIMTMHASKGLEFPIVFLAATESGFRSDTAAIMKNTELGLVLRKYDFDAMRVAETLGTKACEIVNKLKQKEEEMRLLYVAMTRAEFLLDIVGTVTEKDLEAFAKPAKAANSHLAWILSAWKQKYGSVENASSCEKMTVVREKEEKQAAQELDLLCEQYTDKLAVMQQINFAYPYQSQTEMPSKIVSSALDKEYFTEDESRAEFVLYENNDRSFVGTAYHKVYQFVNYDATKEEIAAVIDGLVREGKIEEQYAAQLDRDLIYETLNNAELRRIMSQGKVYHEMPFMLFVPYDSVAVDKRFTDNVMLQGIIDLLVLGENKATVVDFKYTTHSDLVQKKYAAQLNSYRKAVNVICGIDDVDCFVLSIADNKLIKM